MSEHPTTDKPEASIHSQHCPPTGRDRVALLLRNKPDWATLAVVGFALIVVSLVGSCGDDAESAKTLSEAATELADDLTHLEEPSCPVSVS